MNRELSSRYDDLFEQHIHDTQLHLSGASQLEHDSANDDEDILLPPFLPQWTEEESNTFFHGLSIYSRLRPDLIAAHLPNKSAADVTLYIDFFDQQELLDVTHPIALESSPQFIENEESHASSLRARHEDTTAQPSISNLDENFARILERIDRVAAEALDKVLDTDSLGPEHNKIEGDEEGDSEAEQNTPSRESSQGSNLAPSMFPGERIASALPSSRESPVYSIPGSPDREACSPTWNADAHDLNVLHIMTSAERRRYYKKMYMRRKRGVDDDRVENFASGRKRRTPNSHANSGDNSEHDGHLTLAEREQIEQEPEETKSRVTAVEIMTRQLQELGVTPHLLAELDMDLFYLLPLLGLNRKNKPISATAIRLLSGFVIEHVYELVRHAITSRELEVDIKRIEDWGLYRRNELTKENVLSAIRIVHKRHLQKIGRGPAKHDENFGATLPEAYLSDEDVLLEDHTNIKTFQVELEEEEDREEEDEVQDISWDEWISGH